jgi:hypothetical protein
MGDERRQADLTVRATPRTSASIEGISHTITDVPVGEGPHPDCSVMNTDTACQPLKPKPA